MVPPVVPVPGLPNGPLLPRPVDGSLFPDGCSLPVLDGSLPNGSLLPCPVEES